MSQYIELAKIIEEHGVSKVVEVLKEWQLHDDTCKACKGNGDILTETEDNYKFNVCKKCKGSGKNE